MPLIYTFKNDTLRVVTLENLQLRVGDFQFLIEKDYAAEPVNGVAVWVLFREEPCCDDNGHQFRFFLPLGVKNETIKDVCEAFTLATHCNCMEVAA